MRAFLSCVLIAVAVTTCSAASSCNPSWPTASKFPSWPIQKVFPSWPQTSWPTTVNKFPSTGWPSWTSEPTEPSASWPDPTPTDTVKTKPSRPLHPAEKLALAG